jgi:hypothetical protein
MPDIEDDLKLQNWLSVLTFDAFKYVKAGGELVIEWTDEGLVLRLLGVQVDTEGVNSKFKIYALQTAPNVVLEAQT